ncbi:MAG: hypothetical protein AAFX99_36720, partial [Myxococcota bacterium]
LNRLNSSATYSARFLTTYQGLELIAENINPVDDFDIGGIFEDPWRVDFESEVLDRDANINRNVVRVRGFGTHGSFNMTGLPYTAIIRVNSETYDRVGEVVFTTTYRVSPGSGDMVTVGIGVPFILP